MTNVLNIKKLRGYTREERAEIAHYRILSSCSGEPQMLSQILGRLRNVVVATDYDRDQISTLVALGYLTHAKVKKIGWVRASLYTLTPMGEVQLDHWFKKYGPVHQIQNREWA